MMALWVFGLVVGGWENGFDLVVGYVGGDLQTFCGFVCCMVGFEFWLGCFMVLLCSLVCCWFGCLAGLFGFVLRFGWVLVVGVRVVVCVLWCDTV